jgi:hypothetical protein
MQISTSGSFSERYLPYGSLELVSSCEETDTAGDASGAKYARSSQPSVSKSAADTFFCNCKAMAREISSPTGVCLTIPFTVPLPFPFPFLFSFLSSVAVPSPSNFMFASFSRSLSHRPECHPHPLPSSLSLPSLGRLLPQLGASESAQFKSSSLSSIVLSQLCGIIARMSPGLNCRQREGSIFALRSSLRNQ